MQTSAYTRLFCFSLRQIPTCIQTQFTANTEYRKPPFMFFSATANRKRCLKRNKSLRRIAKGVFRLRRIAKGAYNIFRLRRFTKKVLQKKCLRRKKGSQQKKSSATKNVARQKWRVALRATSLAVAVAQNGHLTQMLSPLNSATAN